MYAKVYQKILDSTVARDWYVRHVFMDLLVLADRDGVVDMPIDQIAYRTRGDSVVITRAIGVLCEPDLGSRTQEHEGRRMEPLDDAGYGWRILNYEKYSRLKTSGELAESNRARQRRHKERKRNASGNAVTPVTDEVTEVTSYTHTNTQAERESLSRPPRLLFALWNELRGALPAAKVFTKGRAARARSRLNETPDTLRWSDAILRLTRSKFATGSNDRGWRADFDFLLQPEVLTKIEEGKYDDRASGAPADPDEVKRRREEAMRGL